MQSGWIEVARIGMGGVFLLSVVLDWKARPIVFDLMAQKKVPLPWFFFLGASAWKGLTSIALIVGLHVYWSALSLALYIFIATLVFDNFWAVEKDQRDFTIALFLIHLAACFGLLGLAGAYAG